MAKVKNLPLEGKRVVVTRAAEQSGDVVRMLTDLGAEVLVLPAVAFTDPPDLAPLDEAIRALGDFDWLIFTSRNAVRFFIKRCRALGMEESIVANPGVKVAAVGPATAEAAKAKGLRVDHVAEEYRGEALAGELRAELATKKILLPRSDRAGDDLRQALEAAGAEVTDVVAYQTSAPESFDRGISEAIRRGEVDVVSFFSPSAFHHLEEEVGREALGHVALAAIGPVTSASIRAAGLGIEIEAREATAPALVAAIAGYFQKPFATGAGSP